jgi:hypothetical protein
MPIDISSTINVLLFIERIIIAGILLLSTYRALKIGRALVSSVYRSRAYWLAALMVAFTIAALNTYVTYPNTLLGNFLSRNDYNFPFLVELTLVFAFIDSVILVAMEMDFFHRDTLHWRQLRALAYVIVLVGIFIPTISNSLLFIIPTYLAVIFVVYSIAVLIVASRRTPDRTLKRHTRLLGYAFVIYIVSVLVFSIPIWGNVISDLLVAIFAYLIYLATMALSPLSRIEKEIA